MKAGIPAFSSPWFWAFPSFVAISMLLIALTGANQSLFLFLNKALYFQPETIWINVTLFGDAAMTLVLILPLINKRPDLVVRIFIAALIATFFVLGLKELMMVPRPPAVLPRGVFHQLGNQFSASSFPSGHTTAAFTLSSMIIYLFNNNKVRAFVLLYAALIACSRIASGVHWPMDVLGGMFFGWFSAVITLTLFSKYEGKNFLAQRLVTLILLFAVIHLIFLHQEGDKEARFLEILTPAICFILSLKGLKSLFIDPVIARVKK